MGIPKRMAVAVSGLVFTGGAALVVALAPAAGAETAVTAPGQAISGGAVLGGGGGGGGGGRGGGRRVVVHRAPVYRPHIMHRRIQVHRHTVVRPIIRHIHRPCVSCHNHNSDRFFDQEHQRVRMHKRVIVVNRNRNLSESDGEQFQRHRGNQDVLPERNFRQFEEPQD
jgi:hypothetical protein